MTTYLPPIFERKISVFAGVDKPALLKDVTLAEWLADDSEREQIEYIRTLADKDERRKEKKRLQCATISGRFSYRSANNLIQPSGLICIDIDAKDNTWIAGRWEVLKAKLSKFPWIAYVSLSASGNGLFAIVPIHYPKKHKEHFAALQRDFARMHITLDPQSADVSLPRYRSLDPSPYRNDNATEYSSLVLPEKSKPKPKYTAPQSEDDTLSKVNDLARQIDEQGMNIVDGYDDWIKAGFALASLGEAGRSAFHLCSRQSAKYNETECDKKFDCLMRSGRRFSVATFFWYCSQHGITPTPPPSRQTYPTATATPPPPTEQQEQEQAEPMTATTVATVGNDDEVMTATVATVATDDDDRELSLAEVVEWCAGNLQPRQWAVGKYPPLPWEKE